jgi:hypothetical protein
MANIDKSIDVIFCPLCGTAKESEVYIEESDNEWGPKFYCGTIVWPFKKQVTVQGAKCRVLQKMRATDPAGESVKLLDPGKNLL